MQLSKPIITAVNRLLQEPDWTGAQLAQAIGVTESAVSRWRNGKYRFLDDKNWAKLRPLIAPYLPEGDDPSALPSGGKPETILRRVDASDKVAVPVLGSAAAAGYDSALEPLGEFLSGFDETEDWLADDVDGPGEYFAVRLEGDSMSPEFPNGTVLLVAGGTFPERGDLVVARLSDLGEVVVKEYHRRNGTVELRAINPSGKSYTIDIKAEPGRLLWMWPVVQAKIDLRKRRWERRKA